MGQRAIGTRGRPLEAGEIDADRAAFGDRAGRFAEGVEVDGEENGAGLGEGRLAGV